MKKMIISFFCGFICVMFLFGIMTIIGAMIFNSNGIENVVIGSGLFKAFEFRKVGAGFETYFYPGVMMFGFAGGLVSLLFTNVVSKIVSIKK